jgi:c-di-GMP-binding flagellar brake protein YcgR
MSQTSGLTVRQHQRNELAFDVEFVVDESHRDQVRFSPMSKASEAHVTRGIATDVSSGGLGMLCGQFVPRMCEGAVRVYDPTPVGAGTDGSPIHEVVFEHRVKVRRVTLGSHEPTYALGLAFVDASADIEERVNALLAMAEKGAGPEKTEGGVRG